MTHSVLNPGDLTAEQFQWVCDMVKGLCGINLHEGKRPLVKARLARRLRALGLSNFGEYLDRVQADVDGGETAAMIDALSTNQTHFFREPQHFDVLCRDIVPAAGGRGQRRLRIWSAGCSSGEEPYSAAISLRRTLDDIHLWDIGILATDVSKTMLQVARRGAYSLQRLGDVGPAALGEYFSPLTAEGRGRFQVKPCVRRMVNFAWLNLMATWPMKGLFDVIFCRNVMIYFDKSTRQQLVERFCNKLAPGGTLMVGHSESLTGVAHPLKYVQPSVYRK